MKIIRNISYLPANGYRGLGDFYIPENHDFKSLALVIHGGGWNAMDKNGLAGVAQFLAEYGYGSFAINYRLIDDAPWPACWDDCLKAAEFLLSAGHPEMKKFDRSKLIIIGASAGGHLALMTGLKLSDKKVKCIISIAGPTNLLNSREKFGYEFFKKFFGKDIITDEMFLSASPVNYVRGDSPPLLCVHSYNDKLVPKSESENIVKIYRKLGLISELFSFPGVGQQHGIWVEGTNPRRLLPEIERVILKFLNKL